MEIKLIALDMDGTALDSDHATVPERNIAALRAAAEQGVVVVIASGRPWAHLRTAAEQIGCVRYALTANGASALDIAQSRWLWNLGIPEQQRRELIRLLLDRGIPVEAYAHGDSYSQWDRREQVIASAQPEGYGRTVRENSLFTMDLNAALEGQVVEKLHLFHVPPEARSSLVEEIHALGPIGLDSAFRTNLELVSPGVNKAMALERLCRGLGLGPENVMAFGDAGNDEGMLRWAKWSFAVENATQQAKAAARYTTGSNSEGGVGMAIERWLLAEEGQD